MITILIISFLLCLGYACYVQLKFNVSSISESYYHFENKKKGLGMLFWGWTVVSAFTLLPIWLEVSEDVNYQFVAFLSCVCLIAVGCCPNYKTIHSVYHPLFTGIAMTLAIIWGFLAHIWWVPLLFILIGATVAYFPKFNFKQRPEKLMYWLEIGAFFGLYLSVLLRIIKTN